MLKMSQRNSRAASSTNPIVAFLSLRNCEAEFLITAIKSLLTAPTAKTNPIYLEAQLLLRRIPTPRRRIAYAEEGRSVANNPHHRSFHLFESRRGSTAKPTPRRSDVY